MAQHRTTFSDDFRRFFSRGLAIVLPTILTLWLLFQAYAFVDAQVAQPINRGLQSIVLLVVRQGSASRALPDWFQVTKEELDQYRDAVSRQGPAAVMALAARSESQVREDVRALHLQEYWNSRWYFRLIGLCFAVVLIYLTGVLLGGLVGRRIYAAIEHWFSRLPIVRSVYPHVKQLVDLIFGAKHAAFRQVVLVEFPGPGLWSLAFVTAPGLKTVSDNADDDLLTIFVPTTPTPFTGFTIVVRRAQTRDAGMTVDEAIRFMLTAGVLLPTTSPELVPRSTLPSTTPR
ncbi:MAG: DUF502 domain-containing protein [Phycisphaeraceae bacterium]|nr:DUF502 domain-containing protein [Phycisphaeraceae bacterium]